MHEKQTKRYSRIMRGEVIKVENRYPFGYNADGSHNVEESAIIRYVFAKHDKYFRNPPQKLLDEAYAWAKSEGITLNDEEAADMARCRIVDYIAREVREKFPGVKYRTAAPVTVRPTVPKKYPGKSFLHDDMIDRDLFAQVQAIISRS